MDKKTQKLENKIRKFGNTEVNIDSLKHVTKETFIKQHKSLISTGAEAAADELDKYFKK